MCIIILKEIVKCSFILQFFYITEVNSYFKKEKKEILVIQAKFTFLRLKNQRKNKNTSRYSYLREVVGKKGAKLHEGVVALVEKLAHQLEVILLRLLVDHAVALLGHQQHQRHSQVHLH
jgi:hypothetical protein